MIQDHISASFLVVNDPQNEQQQKKPKMSQNWNSSECRVQSWNWNKGSRD